ncbi:MAG: ABC transporter substrate-binding protein [Alphaproteobacteria bacterium]|nr:ABC transporter substrate-binding protein [Alphaproteobacteria bacterium]
MVRSSASRRSVLKGLAAASGAVALPRFAIAQSKPEVGTVVLAPQFGLAYTPLHVMKAEKLIEKHLAKNGLPNSKVEWQKTTGGAAANEALISGAMHVVSGGVGPLLTVWDKTKGNANVRGIGCFDATALYLCTINPAVNTIRDFTDKDKIALPAVKISIQAVSLQMACEKEFGQGQHTKLDHLTVSMSHPDATAALLSGKSEITAHFSSPPFQYQQIETGKARKVLSNFDVLGGPVTFNSAYTTTKFREENPRSYTALFDALVEAHEFIQKRRDDAVKIYIAEEQSKLSVDFINRMLGPELSHTIVPLNTIKYAEFLHRIGSLRNKPASWKDYYFPDVHGVQGS